MKQRNDNCKALKTPIECLSKLGGIKTSMLSYFVYLSNHYDLNDENRMENNSIQITNSILMSKFKLTEYQLMKTKKELKELGIITYELQPSLPTIYTINFPLLEKEYGYSCFIDEVDYYDEKLIC